MIHSFDRAYFIYNNVLINISVNNCSVIFHDEFYTNFSKIRKKKPKPIGYCVGFWFQAMCSVYTVPNSHTHTHTLMKPSCVHKQSKPEILYNFIQLFCLPIVWGAFYIWWVLPSILIYIWLLKFKQNEKKNRTKIKNQIVRYDIRIV